MIREAIIYGCTNREKGHLTNSNMATLRALFMLLTSSEINAIMAKLVNFLGIVS
jgi:hypothetical protein